MLTPDRNEAGFADRTFHPVLRLPNLRYSKNHFKLFALPAAFSVDERLLVRRYHELVCRTKAEYAEPGGGDDTKALSQALHSIEDAYRTLLDPLARANHLLMLHARSPLDMTGCSGDDTSLGGEDAEALMEQLELRDSLASALSRSESAEALAPLMTDLAERSLVLEKELAALLDDPSAGNLDAAREVLRQLRLIRRCRCEAKERQSERNPLY